MKKAEAVIRPFQLDHVKRALSSVGVQGITVTEVKGFTRDDVGVELDGGFEPIVDYLVSRIRVEIVVRDDQVRCVVEAIAAAAKTDRHGDGKILVTDVSEAVRIRTGETGEAAL